MEVIKIKEVLKRNKVSSIAMIFCLIIGTILTLNGEGQKSFNMLIIACINFIMIGVNELYYVHKRDIEYLNKRLEWIENTQDVTGKVIEKITTIITKK